MDKETNDRLLDAIELLNRTVAAQLEVMERSQDGGAVSIAARNVEFKYEAGEINLDEIFRATALEALSDSCPEGDFKDEIISYHVRAQICMLKRDVFAFSREVALCLETIANKVFSRGNRKRLNTRSKSLKNRGVSGLDFVWIESRNCFKLDNKYLNSLAFKLPEMEKLFNPKRNTEFGIIESLKQFSNDGTEYLLLTLTNSRYHKVVTIYEPTLAVGQSIFYYVNTLFFDKEKQSLELVLVSSKVDGVTSHNLGFYNSRVFVFGNGDVGKLNWIITTLRNYESHGSFKSRKQERELIQQVKAENFDKSKFFHDCMIYLNEFFSNHEIYDYIN